MCEISSSTGHEIQHAVKPSFSNWNNYDNLLHLKKIQNKARSGARDGAGHNFNLFNVGASVGETASPEYYSHKTE